MRTLALFLLTYSVRSVAGLFGQLVTVYSNTIMRLTKYITILETTIKENIYLTDSTFATI
ncbi:hypothetical protein DOT_5258 [Desulfosporosinus sp. OT]|nr:hypothetical protein DOT_5258 [Desulfosporosinus sp. OT]